MSENSDCSEFAQKSDDSKNMRNAQKNRVKACAKCTKTTTIFRTSVIKTFLSIVIAQLRCYHTSCKNVFTAGGTRRRYYYFYYVRKVVQNGGIYETI